MAAANTVESTMPNNLASGQIAGRSAWVGCLLMFLASLVLYAATANRGAQWQDSGNFILRIVTGQHLNPLGLALCHPLHHWLGRFVVSLNLTEPCFAVTLISSIAGALAVANVFGCVLTLTNRQSAALFAAASLAVANTFWQLATLSETYTLSAALLAGECWCLVAYARGRGRYALWGMLLLNGLGLANHLLAILTVPILAVIVLHELWQKRLTAKTAAIGAGLWLLGSLPYTALVMSQFIQTGDLTGTLHSALFGKAFAGQVMNTTLSAGILLRSLAFVALNFPNLLLPAAVYGLLKAGRSAVPPLAKRALLAALVIHAVFVLRYNIVDQHTFFLPTYVLLCIFGGLGASALVDRVSAQLRRKVQTAAVILLLMTPLVYVLAAATARHLDVLGAQKRNKPYRDDYQYLLIPWSVTERSADRMSTEAVNLAGPNGLIIYEDGMAMFAIRYKAIRANIMGLQIVSAGQVRKDSPDAFTDRITIAEGQYRPVVLVPANADEPVTRLPLGTWQRQGDLYVHNPGPATSPATAPR